jgi:hypothetical protein
MPVAMQPSNADSARENDRSVRLSNQIGCVLDVRSCRARAIDRPKIERQFPLCLLANSRPLQINKRRWTS